MNTLELDLRCGIRLLNRILLLVIAIFTLFGLSACGRKDEARYSATLDRQSLMAVVFPEQQKSSDAQTVTLDFSALVDEKYKAEQSKVVGEVSPMYVVRIDETHAAMVTANAPAGDYSCHACQQIIGVYNFVKEAKGWRLSRRQDAVSSSGADGLIGETKVHKVSEGRFVMTSLWGSCWQGYCGNWLVIVGLDGNGGFHLGSIPTGVENDGVRGGCSALDGGQAIVLDDIQPECMQVTSQWKITNSQLVIDFKGRLRKESPVTQPAKVQIIKQRAVYDLQTDKATLVQGKNPVPSF
jgi:hypothetical protein